MMETVTLSMGAGGRPSAELIENVFLKTYRNPVLDSLDDAAEFTVGNARLAFTTDSYTVKPIFFPGGDIGKLSICGTVNDLCAKGAKPHAVSAGFIIEEGFPLEMLKRIAASMHETARRAGVQVVTGDTKVVSAGQADGIFINTSGIGLVLPNMHVSCRHAAAGDAVIISGAIAEHGIAIFNARQGLEFDPPIASDVNALCPLLEAITEMGEQIHCLRDPTRGGVASALNEIAKASGVRVRVFERSLPIKSAVKSCCDILGMDPLYVANEGKMIIFAAPEAAAAVLGALKKTPLGVDAAVIGTVEEAGPVIEPAPVYLETAIGTKRLVPLAEGELLPRIC